MTLHRLMTLVGLLCMIITVILCLVNFATHLVFRGNSTLAGATAAVMANVVLVAYVVVAMREDQSDQLAAQKKESKKDR